MAMELDLEQVEDMASEFCTKEEIADDMGFEKALFDTRQDIKTAFNRGRNSAKAGLRHMLYNAARSGDRTVMLLLAKYELGYADASKGNPANFDIMATGDMNHLNKFIDELKNGG